MVLIGKRMHKLRKILDLRCGSGAAILPPEVTRIHMSFSYALSGHMGPRKFAREELRRLKFWNPSIPMVINRSPNAKHDAVMTIYKLKPGIKVATHKAQALDPSTPTSAPSKGKPTASQELKRVKMRPLHAVPKDTKQRLQPSSINRSSPAPAATDTEDILLVQMLHKQSADILDELVKTTGAQTVSPSGAELSELDSLKEHDKISENDKKLTRMKREEKRKEAALMKKLADKVAESEAAMEAGLG